MSHFANHYDHVRFPIDAPGRPGLRQSQRGAAQAIASHFTLHDTQAVVVMPTGTGKTAVLMLTPYLLCAERALVITPSVFVRDQIRRDYEALTTLKAVGALARDIASPRVFENKGIVDSLEAWEAFREYDVVVTTPNSVSPAQKEVFAPPPDLFDVVLIDEAHHSPAKTWAAVLEAFPSAKKVLFTATPFRRDRREIKGKYIYTYPIYKAFDEGLYGELHFEPVPQELGVPTDVSLACATERRFKQDRDAGLKHVLMVRADSRPKADGLAEVYEANTKLKLQVVHSGHSHRHVMGVVEKLRRGELDGVICVDMLGEGFDLPNLKIAALHAPHRSLAVTLQFLGRFARVNGPDLGRATILAVPSEIEIEATHLFKDSEAWQRMVLNLAQARVSREMRTRESLESFHHQLVESEDDDLGDLSLYSLTPLNHVKIYQVYGKVDLTEVPRLDGFEVVRSWVSPDEGAAVFITRERVKPKWADTDRLAKVEHDLFVVFHEVETDLLFICTTRRDETTYKDLAECYVNGHAQPLPLSKINRVLRGLNSPELFSVGMRNRNHGTVAEAYRIISGSSVDLSIRKSDGQLYHRGHVFGRANAGEGKVTIGVSSLSKVWRSNTTQIPELLEWCRELAGKIASDAPVMTGSGLDFLDTGQEAHAIPDAVPIAADWDQDVYTKAPVLSYVGEGGIRVENSILDFDLAVDIPCSSPAGILLDFRGPHLTTRLRFTLDPFPRLQYLDDTQPHLFLQRKHAEIDLIDYLKDRPLRFHFADGSVLQGNQLFTAPEKEFVPFDVSLMTSVDWAAHGVDIEAEVTARRKGTKSVHNWLQEHLLARGDLEVIFYDHGSGECADFLTLNVDAGGEVSIHLYHCKGSGGPAAGDRVDDVYEVCGQAVKSLIWRNRKRLLEKVKSRCAQGSTFLQGDFELFRKSVLAANRFEFPLEITIVQPGVSRAGLTEKLSSVLASASDCLMAAGCQKLKVICSK